MTDHAELRRLAEQASYFDITMDWMFKPVIAFQKASDPKTVLALLDEIDRLKAENEALRGAVEQLAEMLNSIHVPIDLNEILKGAKQ